MGGIGLRSRAQRPGADEPALSPAPPTPAWWRAFYARERAATDLDALLRQADPPGLALPSGGAVVVPHTRLAGSGAMLAAAAQAIVRSGATRVLALGPLHGLPRARDGSVPAPLHGVLLPGPASAEEFCLDHLTALLARAAAAAGLPAPAVLPRWCGALPATGAIPGLAAARTELEAGAVVMATVDPIHHGHGYGTPTAELRAGPAALPWAREGILAQLHAAQAQDRARLLLAARAWRSDGATVLAVLRELLGPWQARLERLDLTDYAGVLAAAPPTWVASALVVLAPTTVTAAARPRSSAR